MDLPKKNPTIMSNNGKKNKTKSPWRKYPHCRTDNAKDTLEKLRKEPRKCPSTEQNT